MDANTIAVEPLIPGLIGDKIEIPETDGTETIANAHEVFTWRIDADFERLGTNVPGKRTPKTLALVYQMVKDSNFRTVFNIPARTLESLAWEQSQVIAFVRKCKEWLQTEPGATFFLFRVEKEGEETKFFVACVYLSFDGEPCAVAYRLANDILWFVGYWHRFVIPQQTIEL